MDHAPEPSWRKLARIAPDWAWQLLLVAAISVPFILFQLGGEPRELVYKWLAAPLLLVFAGLVAFGLLGVALSLFTPRR